jgi:hypothetical protein
MSLAMSSSEALRIKYADPVDPFEKIPTPWGHMEAWRAAAIATGEVSALTELSKQVRNDSAAIVDRQNARDAELNSREDSIAARERLHAVNVTRFVDFVGKASVLFDRLHKLRADQAEEPLALPPAASKEPEPALSLEDAEVSGAAPGEPSEDTSEGEAPQDPHGEFLKLKAPVTMDEDPSVAPAPQMPIAAGLDKITE